MKVHFQFDEGPIDDTFFSCGFYMTGVEVWETYWKAHPNEDRTNKDGNITNIYNDTSFGGWN